MISGNKRRPGRPKTADPATQRLPVVRVTPSKLDRYKSLAGEIGVPVSEWIRVNLDAALDEDRERFTQKRRETRLRDIRTGRYYQIKIPGNYRTLGYVTSTSGDHVEFRPYVGLAEGGELDREPHSRPQRVHKNQIIDVVPASRQMFQAADEARSSPAP